MKYGKTFLLVRGTVRLVYPTYRLPSPLHEEGPIVYVSHHQNFFGPFILMLWLPIPVRLWVFHVFFHKETGFEQLYNYTFTKRFNLMPWLAKYLSYPLAAAFSAFYQSARAIPVYRQSKKVIHTFRESVQAMQQGERLLIFPDIDYADDSSGTKDLYNGYLYIERYYYKATGEHIRFVPLYVSKERKTITAGEAIQFRDGKEFKEELSYVNEEIMNTLNKLAAEQGDLKEQAV
ncbi:hypothetical protein ACFOZY_15175 [Chungangia koreensis]|uniref:Glycerol acyltransferase n=1 Tax=Chungangia koreensis TaxID=752657 RepID=A0ABV8X7F9_9LACT